MNFDELKMIWATYDQTLQAHVRLNEYMVASMLKERSKGTITGMLQKLRLTSAIFAGLFLFLIAAMVGNAFDFVHWLQYVPMALYMLLSVIALLIVTKEYRILRETDLTTANLRESLQVIIAAHERGFKAMGTIWKLCMAAGFLFGVSMIYRTVDTRGWLVAGLFLGGQLLFLAGLYWLATRQLAISRDVSTLELRQNLKELEEYTNG